MEGKCKLCGAKYHISNPKKNFGKDLCHPCYIKSIGYHRSRKYRSYIPKKLWYQLHPKKASTV
jgi:hypothetical protein